MLPSVLLLTLILPLLIRGVTISEVLVLPTLAQPAWVEIWNPDATAVDLSGFTLAALDENNAVSTSLIPPGTIIQGGAFLLLLEPAQLSFALSDSRGNGILLGLFGRTGQQVSGLDYRNKTQVPGVSYGVSNGLTVYFQNPTPGAANDATSVGLGISERVVPSQPVGWQPQSFLFAMASIDGGVIYYTINTATPLTIATATIYDGRVINVSTSTVFRVLACRASFLCHQMQSFTYVFSNDLLSQTTLPGYPLSSNLYPLGSIGKPLASTPQFGMGEENTPLTACNHHESAP